VDKPPRFSFQTRANTEDWIKGYFMQDMVDHGYLTVENPGKKKLEDWLAVLNKNNTKILDMGRVMDYCDTVLKQKDDTRNRRQEQNKWHSLLWKYLLMVMKERKHIKDSVKMGKKIESSSDLKKQLQARFKSKSPLKALDTSEDKNTTTKNKVQDAMDGWITSLLVKTGTLGA